MHACTRVQIFNGQILSDSRSSTLRVSENGRLQFEGLSLYQRCYNQLTQSQDLNQFPGDSYWSRLGCIHILSQAGSTLGK